MSAIANLSNSNNQNIFILYIKLYYIIYLYNIKIKIINETNKNNENPIFAWTPGQWQWNVRGGRTNLLAKEKANIRELYSWEMNSNENIKN